MPIAVLRCPRGSPDRDRNKRRPIAMSASTSPLDRTTPSRTWAKRPGPGHNYARRYWVFALPAAIIVAAVIVFPWIFTLFMSVHDWKVSGATPFVGMANYAKMLVDERFQWAIVRTLVFTGASVVAPVILGVWAAVCFASNFKFRGLARTVFVLPMMATPRRDLAGMDDDVSSATRCAQLCVESCGSATLSLGVQ